MRPLALAIAIAIVAVAAIHASAQAQPAPGCPPSPPRPLAVAFASGLYRADLQQAALAAVQRAAERAGLALVAPQASVLQSIPGATSAVPAIPAPAPAPGASQPAGLCTPTLIITASFGPWSTFTLLITRYSEPVAVGAVLALPDGRISQAVSQQVAAWYGGYLPTPYVPGLPLSGVPVGTAQTAAEQDAVAPPPSPPPCSPPWPQPRSRRRTKPHNPGVPMPETAHPADLARLRGGPSCPVCGSSAISRPGGVLFCVACGPQALEEIAVAAYRAGVITIEVLRVALGMRSSEQAAAFADMLAPRQDAAASCDPDATPDSSA